MAYVPGYSQGVAFTVDGGGSVALNVTGHSWMEKVEALITTHTGTAGLQTRIAGIFDGEGTVDANVDAAALVHDTAPGVRAGAKGTITHAIGGATPFSIHVLITELLYKSVVNGLVSYSFKCAFDATSGSYTRATE